MKTIPARHSRKLLPAAASLALTGCISFFEFEPPPGHPSRPDAPSYEVLVAPSPFELEPQLRVDESADAAPPMQDMHAGHEKRRATTETQSQKQEEDPEGGE